jgi:peptidoglycan-associated lipoprotein
MRTSTARFISVAAAVVLAMGAMGCKTKPKDTGASTNTGSEWKESTPAPDSGSSMSGRNLGLTVIYFDYDRSDVRGDQRDGLRNNAEKIKSMTTNVVIEGHCDERGSEEYNLALGERRADAVRRYLGDLGVPTARLSTVSFGESRPAVQGHDESAWRYNRRADFVGQ